jgi:hypothetical protein
MSLIALGTNSGSGEVVAACPKEAAASPLSFRARLKRYLRAYSTHPTTQLQHPHSPHSIKDLTPSALTQILIAICPCASLLAIKSHF